MRQAHSKYTSVMNQKEREGSLPSAAELEKSQARKELFESGRRMKRLHEEMAAEAAKVEEAKKKLKKN